MINFTVLPLNYWGFDMERFSRNFISLPAWGKALVAIALGGLGIISVGSLLKLLLTFHLFPYLFIGALGLGFSYMMGTLVLAILGWLTGDDELSEAAEKLLGD